MIKPIFCSLLTGVLLMMACEKNITINPKPTPQMVVVEATIENGQYPVVILSRSLGLFASLSVEMLSESFIHEAEIDISDGRQTHRLKEYTRYTGPGVAYSYYTVDSSSADAFRGQTGQRYELNITVEGREYTASTTIPEPEITVDSIWWEQAAGDDSTKAVLMVTLTDKPGFGNYFRYYTKANDEPFYPGLFSVYDDQVTDGVTYSVEVERGVDRNAELDPDTYNFFDRGDRVMLKLSEIDKATYDFWRTMEFSYTSIGNPFSSPTRVLTNIRGGALGYFGGYATQFKFLQIPE